MANEVDMNMFENCIQDPQTILGKALVDRNIRQFKLALETDADPTRIDETTRMSIFEKALQTYGCSEFVEECLRRGCKADYTNRLLNKRPINFACDSKDPKNLEKLLKYKDINVDVPYANLTPLNSLAKNLTFENYDDVSECIKNLLRADANPNIPDQREMTPILYVLKNSKINNDQKRELTKFFLTNSNIDLDSFRDGEAREQITARFPDINLPENRNSNNSFESLMALLKNENEEKFTRDFVDYQLNTSGKDNQQNAVQEQNLSLLNEAIKKGQNKALEQILNTNVNVNSTEKGNTPIRVACVYGNWKALELLIDRDDINIRNSDNLLTTVIKKLDEPTYHSFCNYYNCFYTLLNSNKIDINEMDQSGSSALHYAVRYKNERAIKELLKRGAYIGTRSVFNDIPISEISPDILEDFFDTCITTNGLKPGDDNFEIIINYTNLVPNDRSGNKSKSIRAKQEMLPIEHMAESKELGHLLKHPLITSFLFLKWHRLAIIFYINFILYTLFWLSLITYIMLNFNNTTDEGVLQTFKIFSAIGLVYLILRELIQFLIAPGIYLQGAVNYAEVAFIILTMITLCEPNYEKETQRVIGVFTILLASVELCLLVGSLPVLSLSTHMLMLQAVSTSFLKSFTLYSIFVITFSLCFYILFGKTDIDEDKPTNETSSAIINGDDDEGEFNKFLNPFTTIIKTIVMLTGEFDAGDINFHSFTSYLVFLLFVFFMSIVLFNLLNGLAVSDTQAIKSQAELNGSICRTRLLCSYEKVLNGKNTITGFLINYRPFREICNNLTNLFPNFISGNYIVVTPNDSNKIYVPSNDNEKDDVALLKGNNNTFQTFSDDLDKDRHLLTAPVRALNCCCNCWNINCSQMDARTVKTAIVVLEKRDRAFKHLQKQQEDDIRLRKIESKVDEILALLQERPNQY